MYRYRWLLVAVVVLVLGGLLKTVAVPAGRSDLAPEAQTGRLAWPWGKKAVVTAYFPEEQTGRLVPVARRVASGSARAALEELFAGPAPGRSLRPVAPSGVRLGEVQVEGDAAVIDVEGGDLDETGLRAVAETLGVAQVTEKGGLSFKAAKPGTKLYYLHRGLPLPVTQAGERLSPREALERLLTGPAPEGVPWVPKGVALDAFEVKGSTAYVRLRFSPELRTLVESGVWNFSPYYMGVVYTLTEYPEIDRVRFEFAGLSQLALKQCRTPLAVPLQRPEPEAGRAGGGR